MISEYEYWEYFVPYSCSVSGMNGIDVHIVPLKGTLIKGHGSVTYF